MGVVTNILFDNILDGIAYYITYYITPNNTNRNNIDKFYTWYPEEDLEIYQTELLVPEGLFYVNCHTGTNILNVGNNEVFFHKNHNVSSLHGPEGCSSFVNDDPQKRAEPRW